MGTYTAMTTPGPDNKCLLEAIGFSGQNEGLDTTNAVYEFVAHVLGTRDDTEALVSDKLCGAPTVHRHYFPNVHDEDKFKNLACTVNDSVNEYDRLLEEFKESCTEEQWKYFEDSIYQGSSSPSKWASCHMLHEREGIYSR